MEQRIGDTTGKRTLNEIDEMIKRTNDENQRAFLVVLSSLNRSMIEVANTSSQNSKQLADHVQESLERHEAFLAHAKCEESLINQGRGAWRILAWILGGAQVAILAWVVHIGQMMDAEREATSELTASRLADIEMHKSIDHRLDSLEKHNGK